MGSENLFHKNRIKSIRELGRKKQQRQQQVRILIICEDSKSSAYYFEDMAKDYGLTAVVVHGKQCGSAPISVVEYARRQYEQEFRNGDPYDRVYCVFDQDQHDSFTEACQKSTAYVIQGKPFFAITSIPCFELWALLHFNFVAKPYKQAGKNSPCAKAIADLRKIPNWNDYDKAMQDMHAKLADKTDTAIKNAKALTESNKKTGSNNPATNIHELVECLQYHKEIASRN